MGAAPPLGRLLRSTPVRQALLLIAVFAIVNLATLGGAWVKMRHDLMNVLRADLAREVAGLDLSATPAALSAIVEAAARASDPADTVIVLLGADGRQTGNAVAVLDGEALRLVPRGAAGQLSDAGYLHVVQPLSGGVVIVAVSLAPVASLRGMFVGLVGFSLVPTVLIALTLAVLVARRTGRRVAAIERVLGRLSAGELSARLAPGRRDDDLARIASSINFMAGQHEAATEALKQVSSDLAHELRLPLQRIAVLIHDLAAQLPEGGAARDLADRATAEADQINAIFRALLQIAQIEGRGQAFETGPVDLGAAAARMFELYQPVVEDAGSAIRLVRPAAAVEVRGDGQLISQALANLVENAIRHTPAGSRIVVEVARDAGRPVLTVADDGPGIPADECGKVVQRLYRLERSAGTPGYGLGLALVSAIARLHGATLALGDNRPGLRASITFPAPDPSRTSRPAPCPPTEAPHVGPRR